MHLQVRENSEGGVASENSEGGVASENSEGEWPVRIARGSGQ